jgi:hypothetical protein
MFKLIILIFTVCFTLQAFSKSGLSSIKIYVGSSDREERLIISSDGNIDWKTSSRGSLCPEEAGRYSGKMTVKDFNELFLLTKEIGKKQNNEVSYRESYVRVIMQSKDYKNIFYIENKSKGLSLWKRKLAILKSKLKAKSVVALSSVKKKDHIKLSFSLKGDRGLKLLFSEKTNESFSLNNNGEITYKGTFRPVIELTKENPVVSIDLISESIPDKYSITYSNKSIIHHKDKKGNTPLVTICSQKKE